jgi:transcriptional regulator with XRE-family HTH domain
LDVKKIFKKSHIKSDSTPLEDPAVARLAAETVRKAYAVGLVDESPDFASLTYPAVKHVVSRVSDAGIGGYAATSLTHTDPSDVTAIARELRRIGSLLEESPLPDTEWPRLLQILDRDRLAALVGVSPSSAARYERGERATPDSVAARLHFLALVVGDLAGAYNAIGVRRWFERPRAALDGHAPADLLAGEWQPDDEGAAHVRALARSIVESPAT